MHVFFITQWYPTTQQPYYGIFVKEHARAAARINKVSMLHIQGIDSTLKRPIQITAQTVQPGFIVYQLSYRRPLIPYSSWLRQLIGARSAYKLACHEYNRPDIIHANVNGTAAVSVALSRLVNIPVVLSEHSSAYARKLLSSSQIRELRFFMNRVDVIMPVCEALGQQIRGYGITRPMVTVQNVVDNDIFFPASPEERAKRRRREIAVIARLSEEKAVHLAIHAFTRLHQQGFNYHLNIAGDGPERNHLESLVKELGVSDRVHFHGYLPKAELAKILRRASLFLLSSIWESQPVVILEALTCGLPVLAPAIGGIPEVVTPACGLLFQTGDIDDLTAKLTAMLTNLKAYDPQAIHQYAVDHFSSDVVGNRLDSIYRQVVKDRHAFDHVPSI